MLLSVQNLKNTHSPALLNCRKLASAGEKIVKGLPDSNIKKAMAAAIVEAAGRQHTVYGGVRYPKRFENESDGDYYARVIKIHIPTAKEVLHVPGVRQHSFQIRF